MNKNTTLPNFPTTIFATSMRRQQALIKQARKKALNDRPGGLASLFDQVLPKTFLDKQDKTSRQRFFGNIPVFWGWTYQVLHSNSSCSNAVSHIQSWCSDRGLPVPASDTSSYCQARKRLPEAFIDAVLEKTQDALRRHSSSISRWKGMRMMALDGSKVDLADTEANQVEYPQHSGQKNGCGNPSMSLAALFDLGTGGLEAVTFGEQSGHDIKHAPELLESCQTQDLLIGDRGFCSYELMALARAKGVETLIRLHQMRFKHLMKTGWKSKNDNLETIWNKPPQPAKSLLTKQQWKALPESMTIRYVRSKGKDRYGRPSVLVIATSLLDGRKYRAKELTRLYLKRWDIEVHLRSLKTTLGLDLLDVKTPEMARKCFKLAGATYNLIRWLMLKACEGSSLSFSAVVYVVRTRANSTVPLRPKSGCISKILEICANWELNIRPGRHEPRAKKRRETHYPYLTEHRSTYREVIHNGRPRKTA